MVGGVVEGIERATFGAVTAGDVDAWLQRHARRRLGTDVAEVVFRSGRVNAVYGLRLAGGALVVAKVHRGHLDEVRTASLAAAVRAQQLLAEASYPCPRPVDGPAATDGLTATVETLLDVGVAGDAHQSATRRAIATALARQVQLLGALPPQVREALRDPPAWAIYQDGPWPPAHDPIFDFTSTPAEHAWIDEVAADAARLLVRPQARAGELVVGHSDWYCGNLRFAPAERTSDGADALRTAGAVDVVAAWDWDSVVCDVEPVIAGMAAASFTDSSASGAQCPTPGEAAAFLADYDACRPQPFTDAEQVTAAASVTWTLAYNARCQADVVALGFPLPDGPVLHALEAESGSYLDLRW